MSLNETESSYPSRTGSSLRRGGLLEKLEIWSFFTTIYKQKLYEWVCSFYIYRNSIKPTLDSRPKLLIERFKSITNLEQKATPWNLELAVIHVEFSTLN
jgi:hypothetical protein